MCKPLCSCDASDMSLLWLHRHSRCIRQDVSRVNKTAIQVKTRMKRVQCQRRLSAIQFTLFSDKGHFLIPRWRSSVTKATFWYPVYTIQRQIDFLISSLPSSVTTPTSCPLLIFLAFLTLETTPFIIWYVYFINNYYYIRVIRINACDWRWFRIIRIIGLVLTWIYI